MWSLFRRRHSLSLNVLIASTRSDESYMGAWNTHWPLRSSISHTGFSRDSSGLVTELFELWEAS